jgi:hypothetical protein
MTKKNKHKKILLHGLLYAIAAVIGVVLMINILGGLVRGDLFQGSLLSLLNRVGLTDFDEGYPDVGIEYVYLRKTANPSEKLPYYKYAATVVVRNYGEKLENGSVVLKSGDGQKSAFVSNTMNGLNLDRGQTFIFDDYEVMMDGRFNYGQFDFSIEPKQRDGSIENDSYFVDIFEEPMKLGGFAVSSIGEDGGFAFEYVAEDGYEDKLAELRLDICYAENSDFVEDLDLKYTELDTDGDVYSYYKIKAFKDLLVKEEFECEEIAEVEAFDYDNNYVVFLRAVGVDDERFYAVSNAVNLPVQRNLNRAEFMKAFVDYAEIDLYAEGKMYYEDVDEEAWYAPFVKTMFNYGLIHDSLNFTFGPEDEVTRAEVLEPVLNYFDIDLAVDEGAPHFYDVSKDSDYFYFAEALYAAGHGKALGIHIHPEKRMSEHFLKYLIDEFKKT